MFRTHDADMLGLPGMFGEGQYQWHQVSKVLRNHWYHVTVQAKYEDRISEAVLMIDSEPRLQQLLISQDAETIITEVQVVTPAHMNGTGVWRMEKLTADSTPFGHSAHADPDTCSTLIRTGSRSAATQGWHC